MLLLLFGTGPGGGTQTVTPTGIASDEAFGTPTVTPGAVTVSPTSIHKPVDDAYFDVTGNTGSGNTVDSCFQATLPALNTISSSFQGYTHATVADWTPGATVEFALWNWGANQFNLTITSTGAPLLRLTGVTDGVSGAGLTLANAVPSPALVDGDGYWWLFDYDAVGNTVDFYYSADPSTTAIEDITWTQVGTSVAVTGSSSSANTTAEFGDAGGDRSGYFDGQLRRGRLVMDGTIEADIDFRHQENGDTSFTDLVGNSWTGFGVTNPPAVTVVEAIGTPQINQTITTTGISSGEAFGTPVVAGPITATGISSGEAFGTSTVTPGNVTITPASILSEESFLPDYQYGYGGGPYGGGEPDQITVSVGAVTVSPTGIPSEEAFGTPVVSTGAVIVSPTGIASGEAFGTPQINITIYPVGFTDTPTETFGVPTVIPGAVTITPTGITSGEAFGVPTIVQTIAPTGITSGEAFGTPTVVPGAVTISPTGITSGEAVGVPQLNLTIYPTGITSGEAFGVPELGLRVYYKNVIQTIGLVSPVQTISVVDKSQTIAVLDPTQASDVEQTVEALLEITP